ncbi:SDR family oxidoreductase [Caenimonas sedimenti]|uniref:SDR family oxidoreductase n=1 Tax=Caenimonas sedimenti TaxID=2596921 RepID=A0A562ZDV0_9BURK|nr:glucose 1-dehydrogenase [Caenimonas sedimenti]TWO64903.1 SDR family oxidoreductase [Caenimonas sedimenti]
MTDSMNGKVALVTGCGAGIGRAIALEFAAQGARLILGDIDAAGAGETVRLVQAAGGDAFFVRADVTRSAEVEALVGQGVAHFGRLDYAVNNAGVEGDIMVPLAEYAESTWDRVLDINLKGVFLCMKHELPHLVASGGALVNIASVAGLSGGAMGSAYYASKHGVVGLTRAAAIEYARRGVRVNAIAPGIVETGMTERGLGQDERATARAKSMHPLGRFATPAEVARAAVWLCSTAASFITGHALPVDGGYLVP